MLDLVTLFDSFQPPQDITEQSVHFSAQPIPGYERHRLGKDSNKRPSLLIAAEQSSLWEKSIPIRLRNLEVQYNVKCLISRLDGIIEEGNFTFISCTSDDKTVQIHFLRITGTIVASLGANPSQQLVAHTVNKVLELFQAMTAPPRKTIQGLWAELFLIARTTKPSILMRAWHNTPEDRYDFCADNQRIEVKSVSGSIRQHHFSLEQLNPPTDANLLIASVFVERAGNGTSILELVERVRSRISSDIHLLFQLDRVIALTLGKDWQDGLDEGFDYQLAEESLAFFEASSIPTIDPHIPSSVSNVHFKSDLSGIPVADISHYRSLGKLFQVALHRR